MPNDTSAAEPNDPNVQALRELLQVEEKKLSVLKTIHGLQGGTSTTKSISSIQGSALNKASGRPSGRSSPSLRASQPKHSIVVVPGNQATQLQASASSTTTNSGISPRLQQLVDNIGVATAGSALKSSMGAGKGISKKLVAVTTPPVPGLTSLSTSKYNLITSTSNDRLFQQISANSIPQIKPKIVTTNRSSSHEIITISDSPRGSKNPPPLLSAFSSSSLKIPTATSNGSIQVPTISSTLVLGQLPVSSSMAITKSYVQTAEATRRYREQLLKQTHAKKSFQKQIERKMVVAPYPKTFRQVWPLIPVHDSSFVRNFGLESVMHHFDPNSKAAQEKSNSKVKPICNQCGCDFASAWQIRKSNSKQLLLCEACDFQNLKILQRSKLSNQLKELRESIKAEVDKFTQEWEERFHDLEKKATEAPPPLTSQLISLKSLQRGSTTVIGSQVGGKAVVVGQQSANSRYQVASIQGKQMQAATQAYLTNSTKHTIVIPSILGQKSDSQKQTAANEVVVVGSKRPSGGQAPPPPSKVYKPGSALDQTLNRLSKQLIKRKLDEHRQECQPDPDPEQEEQTAAVVLVGGEPLPVATSLEPETVVTSPTSPSSFAGQKTKSRRKGTPKHKRHLSASSMNSE